MICDFDPLRRSMKAQMKQADRMNARFVVILGEDEFRSGSVAVRSMREGWQKTVHARQRYSKY
jgi:histidyl-tRNA synthetase